VVKRYRCGPFEIRAKQGAKGRIIGGCDLQPYETEIGKPEAATFCMIITLFPLSNRVGSHSETGVCRVTSESLLEVWMRSRSFEIVIFAAVLLSSAEVLSKDKTNTMSSEKAVEWVDIRVPKFPPLARQARIFGAVAIEVRFKGCALDPASPNVVSGHPMLAPAAVESLKQSTFRCGDFPDSKATLYYEFGEYPGTTCGDSRNPRVEVAGSHIRVLATVPCLQP
jgi:hypothetical protein